MSHSVTTVNPYTLKNIKTYQVQSKEDVMKALDKSDKAFQNWKLVEIEEKTELLLRKWENLFLKASPKLKNVCLYVIFMLQIPNLF